MLEKSYNAGADCRSPHGERGLKYHGHVLKAVLKLGGVAVAVGAAALVVVKRLGDGGVNLEVLNSLKVVVFADGAVNDGFEPEALCNFVGIFARKVNCHS